MSPRQLSTYGYIHPPVFVRPVPRSDSLCYFGTTVYNFTDCYITCISVIAVSKVFLVVKTKKKNSRV